MSIEMDDDVYQTFIKNGHTQEDLDNTYNYYQSQGVSDEDIHAKMMAKATELNPEIGMGLAQKVGDVLGSVGQGIQDIPTVGANFLEAGINKLGGNFNLEHQQQIREDMAFKPKTEAGKTVRVLSKYLVGGLLASEVGGAALSGLGNIASKSAMLSKVGTVISSAKAVNNPLVKFFTNKYQLGGDFASFSLWNKEDGRGADALKGTFVEDIPAFGGIVKALQTSDRDDWLSGAIKNTIEGNLVGLGLHGVLKVGGFALEKLSGSIAKSMISAKTLSKATTPEGIKVAENSLTTSLANTEALSKNLDIISKANASIDAVGGDTSKLFEHVSNNYSKEEVAQIVNEAETKGLETSLKAGNGTLKATVMEAHQMTQEDYRKTLEGINAEQITKNVTTEVTPTDKAVAKLTEEYNQKVESIRNSPTTTPEQKVANLKAAGMQYAAKKRIEIQNGSLDVVENGLTPNELTSATQKRASNYVGKEVLVDGKKATISKPPAFKKPEVIFEDGTTVRVKPEQIEPFKNAERKLAGLEPFANEVAPEVPPSEFITKPENVVVSVSKANIEMDNAFSKIMADRGVVKQAGEEDTAYFNRIVDYYKEKYNIQGDIKINVKDMKKAGKFTAKSEKGVLNGTIDLNSNNARQLPYLRHEIEHMIDASKGLQEGKNLNTHFSRYPNSDTKTFPADYLHAKEIKKALAEGKLIPDNVSSQYKQIVKDFNASNSKVDTNIPNENLGGLKTDSGNSQWKEAYSTKPEVQQFEEIVKAKGEMASTDISNSLLKVIDSPEEVGTLVDSVATTLENITKSGKEVADLAEKEVFNSSEQETAQILADRVNALTADNTAGEIINSLADNPAALQKARFLVVAAQKIQDSLHGSIVNVKNSIEAGVDVAANKIQAMKLLETDSVIDGYVKDSLSEFGRGLQGTTQRGQYDILKGEAILGKIAPKPTIFDDINPIIQEKITRILNEGITEFKNFATEASNKVLSSGDILARFKKIIKPEEYEVLGITEDTLKEYADHLFTKFSEKPENLLIDAKDVLKAITRDTKLKILMEAKKILGSQDVTSWKTVMKNFVMQVPSAQIYSMLSGVVTHKINLLTGIINSVMRPVVKLAGATIVGDKQIAEQSMIEMLTFTEHLNESFKLGGRAFMREQAILGKWSFDPNELKLFGDINLGAERPKLFSPEAMGLDADSTIGKFFNGLGQFARFSTRGMIAGDELLTNLNYRTIAKAESYMRAAERLGLDKPDFNNIDFINTAEDIFKNEMFNSAKLPSGELIETASRPNILHEARQGMFMNPLPTMSKEVQLDTPTYLTHMAAGVSKTLENIPFARPLVPFTKATTWIVETGSDYGNIASFKLWGNVRNGFREGASEMERFKAIQSIGKITVGSGIMATAYTQAMGGNITGSPPINPAARKALLDTGWKPSSFVFNNKDGSTTYIPFSDVEPISTLLTLAADTHTIASNLPDHITSEDITDIGLKILYSLTNNFSNKSFIKSLGNEIDLLQIASEQDASSALRTVGNILTTLVPNGSLMRWATDDGTIREVRGLLDGFLGIVHSKSLSVHRDNFGDPVTYIPNNVNVLSAAVSPFRKITSVRGEPEDKELVRLTQLGFAPITPEKTSGSVEFLNFKDKDGITAWDKIQELKGGSSSPITLRQKINELVNSSAYQNAPDMDGKHSKKNMINKVMAHYIDRATKSVIRSDEFVNPSTGQTLHDAMKSDRMFRNNPLENPLPEESGGFSAEELLKGLTNY